MGAWQGVSKKVEDGRRSPALWEGCKAVLGVAHPHGVEGLGMAGPSETLESPWRPLPIRPWNKTWLYGKGWSWTP
jgi:hypothetical protein